MTSTMYAPGEVLTAPLKVKPQLRLFKVGMGEDAIRAASEVLASGYIGQGERVEAFEGALAYYYRLPHRPVTVNSATSGLHLALTMTGVGPGSEVITTPMTCSATNTPIVHLGARIVWADVDPVTGCIDPNSVAGLVSPRTTAIVAVDWAGRPCDYARLRQAAPGVPIIQDAAHAGVGALTRPHGDYVVWSYQAIKYLTCGDGGALFCPDPERARLLRWYGLDRTSGESFRCAQDITEVGHKWHMNDVAAAIGLANLPTARDNWLQQTRNAAHYATSLPDGQGGLTLPPWDSRCSWWLYTVLVEERERFADFLATHGIETSQVHRRNDVHTAFAAAAWEDPLAVVGRRPGVDEFAARQLAIPVGWWLSNNELDHVCEVVRAWQP